MKNIVTTFLLISCFHFSLLAQQGPQYTHFMQNKMAFNPAYAGSQEAASISALYRYQWAGVDGAPTTQTLFTHMPLFENRVGFGLGLIRDTHGAVNDWQGTMAYAYRIQIGKGKLSLGVQGSVKAQQVDWAELMASADPNDPVLPIESSSKILPGFGAGAYYYNKKFYAGVSIPNMLKNNLEYMPDGQGSAVEVRHLYLMTGTQFNLGNSVKVMPGVLFKYIHNTPFDADFNVSFLFADKLLIGTTYRLEDAVAGLIGVDIADRLRIGVSYDYTLSEFKNANNNIGSFEVFAEYLFKYKNKDIYNPRFFF